jgi:hypothetical protein
MRDLLSYVGSRNPEEDIHFIEAFSVTILST